MAKLGRSEPGRAMMGTDSSDNLVNMQVNADGTLPITVTGDVNVDETNLNTSGMVGKPAGAGGDFDVVWTSATQLTCTMPAWYANLTADDILVIRQIDNTGAVVATYSRDDAAMSVGANVITVTGAAFTATDTFVIYTDVNVEAHYLGIMSEWDESDRCMVNPIVGQAGISGNAGAMDATTTRVTVATDDTHFGAVGAASDVDGVIHGQLRYLGENMVQELTDGPTNLVTDSDIGVADNVWKQQGQIAMGGYTKLFLYVKMTVNDSTGNQLQVLSRHTTGGDDYVMADVTDYQVTIGDSSINIVYEFTVDNGVPFVMVETRATDVLNPAGDEATVTIDYVRSWV